MAKTGGRKIYTGLFQTRLICKANNKNKIKAQWFSGSSYGWLIQGRYMKNKKSIGRIYRLQKVDDNTAVLQLILSRSKYEKKTKLRGIKLKIRLSIGRTFD